MQQNVIQPDMQDAGIKIKIKKPKVEVPDLLLAYTYFLNNAHSCHLTIGYDVDDFSMKIILFKNNMYHTLLWEDWGLLWSNSTIIQNHFDGQYGIDFLELPRTDGNCSFKISVRNGEKCFISVQKNKKIVLEILEWRKLFSLVSYINAIAMWYNATRMEIQRFYDRYLELCIEKNVFKLNGQDFFKMIEVFPNSFNHSRMFNELSVFCHRKLQHDIHQHYKTNDIFVKTLL